MHLLSKLFLKDQSSIVIVVTMAGVIGLLIKFWWWSLRKSLEREERLNNVLTNHIQTTDKTMVLVSENLKNASEEHQEMIKQLVMLNERVKKE